MMRFLKNYTLNPIPYTLLALLLLPCSLLSYVQLDLLSLGAGAANIGRGNTYIGGEITNIYYNPGGLPFIFNSDILYQHTELDFGTTYDYFTLGTTIKPLSLTTGFSFMRIATGDIPITEAGEDTIPGTDYLEIIYRGTASYKASCYTLSLSKRIKDFGIGINGKFIDMLLYQYSGTGISTDIGGYYQNKIFFGGIAFRDILNTGIRWSGGINEDLLPVGSALLGFTLLRGEGWFEKGITISGRADKVLFRESDPLYYAGIEWSVAGILPLRFGIEDGNIAFGMGFNSEHLYFDYAYSTREEIKGNHNISLGWRW